MELALCCSPLDFSFQNLMCICGSLRSPKALESHLEKSTDFSEIHNLKSHFSKPENMCYQLL